MIMQELGRVADQIVREFRELAETAPELEMIADRFQDLQALGTWDVLEFDDAEAPAKIERIEGRCFPDQKTHGNDGRPQRS